MVNNLVVVFYTPVISVPLNTPQLLNWWYQDLFRPPLLSLRHRYPLLKPMHGMPTLHTVSSTMLRVHAADSVVSMQHFGYWVYMRHASAIAATPKGGASVQLLGVLLLGVLGVLGA